MIQSNAKHSTRLICAAGFSAVLLTAQDGAIAEVLQDSFVAKTAFEAGRGVNKDIIEACKWFSIAENRLERASNDRILVEKMTSKNQIAKAKDRGEEWIQTLNKKRRARTFV